MEYRLDLPASQERVAERLKASLEADALPQAILITGSVGVGKRALAMRLARILSCTGEKVRPCGECPYCRAVRPEKGESPWLWVVPLEGSSDRLAKEEDRTEQTKKVLAPVMSDPWDVSAFPEAGTIRVESIRDVLRELGRKDPRPRVVLIPEADRMAAAPANALLKTLEEVPENCHFILTTAHRADMLPTILSRCAKIHLPEATVGEVGAFLEKRGIPADDLDQLWALAGGSPGKAAFMAGETVSEARALAMDLLEWSAKETSLELLSWWAESAGRKKGAGGSVLKESARHVAAALSSLIDDMMRANAGLPARNAAFESRLRALPFAGEGDDVLVWMHRELLKTARHAENSVDPEKVFLALALKWRNERPRLDLSLASEEGRG